MTDPTRRHLAIVLDRSGSMRRVKDDTEGGLRAFLDEQHTAPGHTTVSLYTFDDRHEVAYENRPLAEVPAFELRPRGSTALLDAIGRTITTVGEQLAALPEDQRPGEVVVVILTDGRENCSREYGHRDVTAMITEQETRYAWRVVFLGADQDAIAAAGSMGIRADSSLSYASANTEASMTSAGRMVARGTRTGAYAFTKEERDAAQ